MIRFNKISTESNFIKALLSNTHLPLIRTIREGDYITEGRLYILKCNVIKCIKSGYIGSKNILHNTPIADWRNVGEYHFAEKNGKLCTNFVSNTSGYDSLTHEKLGEYLRALRDMYELNLMPLYNCFSNNNFNAHEIKVKKHDREQSSIINTGRKKETKIYKVPVRFNTDYTICIDNVGLTTIAPAFIKNEHLLHVNNTNYGNDIDVTSKYINMTAEKCITTYANLSYKQPFKVRFDNFPREIKEHIEYEDKGNPHLTSVDDTILNIYFNIDPTINKTTFNARLTKDYIVAKNNKTQEIAKVKPADKFNNDCSYYVQKQIKGRVYTLEELSNSQKLTIARATKKYNITAEDCKLFDISEPNLYMLIQVPSNFESNITILEGDYTQIEADKEIAEYYVNTLPQFVLDSLYTHNLSLMNSSCTQTIPCSKTLIEYLLWNAMSDLDSINNNMDRLQGVLRYWFGDIAHQTHLTNFWQPYYRALLSRFATEYRKAYIPDSLGYVTKDVEELLYKGR